MSNPKSSRKETSAQPNKESGKPPRRGKVHSFGDALDAKVERASKALGFAPTSGPVSASASDAPPTVAIEAGEQLLWLDVDAVDDNPFQPRTDYPNDKQLDLIRTINEDGQLMPIGVRPHPNGVQSRYQARFGHRRKHAVGTGAVITDETGEERRVYANAGVKQSKPSDYIGKIWCVVRAANDAEMRREAWQENAARLALPIMDQARFFVGTREALSQGREKAASWQKVTDFLGETDRVYVYRVASLLELPDAMKGALEVGPNGEKPLLNERHGRALLLLQTSDGAESHKKAQRELFREIKKELLSGAEADRRAKDRRQFLAQKSPSQEDRQLFQMQEQEKQASAQSRPNEQPRLRSVDVGTQPTTVQSRSADAGGSAGQADNGALQSDVAQKEAGKNIESAPISAKITHVGQLIETTQNTLRWARGHIENEPEIEPIVCETLIETLKKLEREARGVRSALELKIDPSLAEKEYEG